eukprot:632032-Amphidinium_carterae.1
MKPRNQTAQHQESTPIEAKKRRLHKTYEGPSSEKQKPLQLTINNGKLKNFFGSAKHKGFGPCIGKTKA